MTRNTSGIVTVGAGRGFVMDAGGYTGRVVITAAHCLPDLPPPHAASHTEERTYRHLLSPLGDAPSIWAECLFVDPVADLAVLAAPDNQELCEEADAFDRLVDVPDPFSLGRVPLIPPHQQQNDHPPLGGWVLNLAGVWTPCQVRSMGRFVSVVGVTIQGGMSGSPLLVDDAAVGVIALGPGVEDAPLPLGSPAARLALHLPVWLVQALEAEKAASGGEADRQ